MEKRLRYTWIILMILTVLSGALSYVEGLRIIPVLILVLASLKFILVAFEFMEVRLAHPFWKVFVVGYVVIFTGIFSIILLG